MLSSTALSHTNVDISSQIFGLTPLSPEEENLIPDELKMVLKKLSKKDVTTKLKVFSYILYRFLYVTFKKLFV